MPTYVKTLFVLPLLTAAMTIALPVMGVRGWSASWSIMGRVHYTLLTLANVAFTWFLHTWNLLGFHF